MTFQLIIKMISATIMAFFTAIGGIFMPVQKKEICFIGHRGYSGVYHQNTALAFEKAAQNGFGGCETDIRMTSDGVYVCSHDGEITLEDGTELEVAKHTLAELTAKPLKNSKIIGTVYLCTYKEYLEIMKKYDLICFIELKGDFGDEQVKEIFDIAAQTYDLQKCILQSFEFENLLKARALFPDLPLMLTYGDGDTGYEKCFEYNISIDAYYGVMTEEMVKEFHDRGLSVGVWTANDPLSLSYCKSLGVDYIESDFFSK